MAWQNYTWLIGGLDRGLSRCDCRCDYAWLPESFWSFSSDTGSRLLVCNQRRLIHGTASCSQVDPVLLAELLLRVVLCLLLICSHPWHYRLDRCLWHWGKRRGQRICHIRCSLYKC